MLCHVILSAAKNLQATFETSRWPEILRCAQNDTSGPVSYGRLLSTGWDLTNSIGDENE